MTDLVLAIAHHLLVFSLAAILAVEWALLRPGLSGRALALVASADRAYGGVAMLVLAVGFSRVFLGLKGAEFYLENPVFWTKIAAFALVGLLSIAPTMRILRWSRARRTDTAFTAPEAEFAAIRRFVNAEALVFLSIPAFAAAMARGYGY